MPRVMLSVHGTLGRNFKDMPWPPTTGVHSSVAPVWATVKMETAHHGINFSLVPWQRQLSLNKPIWFIWKSFHLETITSGIGGICFLSKNCVLSRVWTSNGVYHLIINKNLAIICTLAWHSRASVERLFHVTLQYHANAPLNMWCLYISYHCSPLMCGAWVLRSQCVWGLLSGQRRAKQSQTKLKESNADLRCRDCLLPMFSHPPPRAVLPSRCTHLLFLKEKKNFLFISIGCTVSLLLCPDLP